MKLNLGVEYAKWHGWRRLVYGVRHPAARQRIKRWAKWGVTNTARIHYSEDMNLRGMWLNRKPGALPFTTDCSGFVTSCYKWAGLPDPNGLNYREVGYTGTLLQHAPHVFTDKAKAKAGDLIVYGPGTGEHVAVIVAPGADPLTVSHGDEAGPELVRVSQDGRMPQRILRYLP